VRGRIFLPVGAKPTMGAVGGFDNLLRPFLSQAAYINS